MNLRREIKHDSQMKFGMKNFRVDVRGDDAAIIWVMQTLKMLGKGGHLSIFAGMPKPDSEFPIDLNLIHYGEINVHGANSSARAEYLEARDLIVSGKIDAKKLITHSFSLDDFNKGVAVQADPAAGGLKIVIIP